MRIVANGVGVCAEQRRARQGRWVEATRTRFFPALEALRSPQKDAHWVFQYRRCRQCGFAVRVILREIPDTTLVNSLRAALARAFVRNAPE